jgi:hypothetical protein
MADYRDPKVTTPGVRRENTTGKWIGIAVAVLVVLLLIAWFGGYFGGADVEPVGETPATEGTAPATGGTTTPPATGGTTPPATEQPATPPAQQ